MLVLFDPIAREVTLDLEDGRSQVSLPASNFMVKIYGEEGFFFAESLATDRVEVGFVPGPEASPLAFRIEPLETLTWQVVLLNRH